MAAAICPNGHLSDTDDYCDQCGAKIGGDPAAPAPAPATETGPPSQAAAPPAGPSVACPACGAPNSPDDKFCEVCGYDMALGAPGAPPAPPAAPPEPAAAPPAAPASATLDPGEVPAAPAPPGPASAPAAAATMPSGSWGVVASADQAHYGRMQAEDIPFPAVYPERTFALTLPRNVIGRRSASRGINPEIDLSGAPEDPGVSHLHAVLVGNPEGAWTIIDPGSSNGTFLNEDPDPIPANKAMPLADGDQIHIGAWTTLTIHRI